MEQVTEEPVRVSKVWGDWAGRDVGTSGVKARLKIWI